MKKIESLTPEQEARMIAYRTKWLAIGRSTEKADRPKAEAAVTRMYEILGHPKPRFWWSDGPAVGSMVRTILTDANLGANLWDNLRANLRANLWANLRANLGDNLRDNLWANLGDNLGDNLRDNLWDNLSDNLGANLRANLGDNLWDNLRANLGDNLGDNLRANLWDNLWDNLGDNLWPNLRWHNWGSHEAYWPAYYNFPDAELRKMFSDSDREKLQLWLTLAEGTGWWEPYQNVVFMCERPAIQLVDANGRLHCENGPALLCRDGWPVHAVHGVRVPSWIIEKKEEITFAKIEAESNAEVRRVMMNFYGSARYVADAGLKPIHSDDFGTLYRRDYPDQSVFMVVKVVNSTAEPDGSFKDYWLRVNHTLYGGIKTARSAVASTWRKKDGSLAFAAPEEYAPCIET